VKQTSFCCNCADKVACCEPGPLFLILFTCGDKSIQIKTKTPLYIQKPQIYLQFHITCYLFLLVFSIRLQESLLGEVSRVHVIDNQWSSDVMVVGVWINLGLRPRTWMLSLHQLMLSYLLEDQALFSSERLKLTSIGSTPSGGRALRWRGQLSHQCCQEPWPPRWCSIGWAPLLPWWKPKFGFGN
jgi:hypothetical protein